MSGTRTNINPVGNFTEANDSGIPTPPQKLELGILGKLGGRKFLMAIFGVLALALHNRFGIDTESVLAIGGIIATFILGQSYSEAKTGGATSTTTPVTDPVEVSRIDHATEVIRQETEVQKGKTAIITSAIERGTRAGPDIADLVKKNI